MNFNQQPDHPHHAAVHLMKALKCCKECSDVSEADLLELRELQYRKEMLAQELSALNYRSDSVLTLREEVKELQLLVLQLRNENAQAQRVGIEEIGQLSTERHRFQNEQREGILFQLNSQKNLTHELTLQLQSLMERVKYLNRINNELIYNFCAN